MRRLIRGFAGCTYHNVGNLMSWLKCHFIFRTMPLWSGSPTELVVLTRLLVPVPFLMKFNVMIFLLGELIELQSTILPQSKLRIHQKRIPMQIILCFPVVIFTHQVRYSQTSLALQSINFMIIPCIRPGILEF